MGGIFCTATPTPPRPLLLRKVNTSRAGGITPKFFALRKAVKNSCSYRGLVRVDCDERGSGGNRQLCK
jgi:hypothetical protein